MRSAVKKLSVPRPADKQVTLYQVERVPRRAGRSGERGRRERRLYFFFASPAVGSLRRFLLFLFAFLFLMKNL